MAFQAASPPPDLGSELGRPGVEHIGRLGAAVGALHCDLPRYKNPAKAGAGREINMLSGRLGRGAFLTTSELYDAKPLM